MTRFPLPLFAATVAVAMVAVPGSASAFTASYSWAGIPACGKISPAIKLSDVPAGTKRLRMFMTDLDAPMFHHGGSVLPYYGGDEVKQAAIDYIGPCPPDGQHHRYTWTIEALDDNGDVIDSANVTQTFPP